MSVAIVTGSSGLIGSETAKFLDARGLHVVGIDNDMRRYFFGREASTDWNTRRLQGALKDFEHHPEDVRDAEAVGKIFGRYGSGVALVVHTAAQPSHDWAAREPFTDFTVNANGTLVMLEAARRFCPDAVRVFTSTNKVYGDTPNALPLSRRDAMGGEASHPFASTASTEMTIDSEAQPLRASRAPKCSAGVMRTPSDETGAFAAGA